MSVETKVSKETSADQFKIGIDKWFGYILNDLNEDCDIFLDEKLIASKGKDYKPFSFEEKETRVYEITCIGITVATAAFTRNKSDIELVIPKIKDNKFNREMFINFFKAKKGTYEKYAIVFLNSNNLKLNLTW